MWVDGWVCVQWVLTSKGTMLSPSHPHSNACPTCWQLILGFVRPKPGGNIRPFWNAVHHNLGRLTIISAWATLYIGIYMAHESLTYESSYLYWLTPCVAVMGTLVLLDVVLTLYNALRGDAAAEEAHMDKLEKLDAQPNGTVGHHGFQQQAGSYTVPNEPIGSGRA